MWRRMLNAEAFAPFIIFSGSNRLVEVWRNSQTMEPYFRKKFYQDAEVARTYDSRKQSTPAQQRDYRATTRAVDRILHLAAPGASLLDCPVGTGRFIDLAMRRRLSYTGADISMPMLQIAREKLGSAGEDIRLLRADATCLPFDTEEFDIVLAFKFISLLPVEVRRAALSELARVTKKYLVVQSKHLRTYDPWRQCKRGYSKLFGQSWRINKYDERDALPAFIAETVAGRGLIPLGRFPIVLSPWHWLWPFRFEYLYVFQRPD